jgi:hypothetical protein
MIHPDRIFGRIGNRMWQGAFLYSYSKDHDTDFYFQDPYYFKDHEEAVRTLYSSDIPSPIDAVAIHVRRGDYVNNPFYVDLMKTDYYKKAMKHFSPKEKFIVFSDDIVWCELQPIFKGCEFSYEDEIDDMNKMAACKAHIISNSSFGFWSAWLSPEYPHNKVIAPKNYYADGIERTVLPEHWIKI